MKGFKIISTIAIVTFALVQPFSGLAQTTKENSETANMKVTKTADMTYGEVRKIDKEAGKITLKHGKIENLDMPGMTMVFQVKSKSLLDDVKVGDKVKFKAAKENGKLTVTDIKADK